jgi:hypothetical protein
MTPTKMWKKLARQLGFDGNPLRRRSDMVAAWLLPVAIVVFIALCPVIYGVMDMWVHQGNAALQRAAQSSHRVHGVLLEAVPGPEQPDNAANLWTVEAPARWHFDGQTYVGSVPALAGSKAGTSVRILLDRAGKVQSPPLTAVQVNDRIFSDTLIGLAALAVLLTGVSWGIRSALDRRRIAGWEVEWLAVGPRWSRQG